MVVKSLELGEKSNLGKMQYIFIVFLINRRSLWTFLVDDVEHRKSGQCPP